MKISLGWFAVTAWGAFCVALALAILILSILA
jgi:hypothetical protein